jgi:hypothetical protein
MRLYGRVMHAAEREDANTGLLQSGQARRDKAAVLLIRARCIEEITGLQKQVNSLADGKICRLSKGAALALALFFAFARRLTGNTVPQVIIGSQY